MALMWLVACTGGEPADSGGDSGTTTDTDTDTDTTTEPTPVWTEYRVETSATLQGVYASGEGVYVVGTGGTAWVGGASTTWTAMNPEVEENDLTDVWGQGAGDAVELFATAHSGYVAHYSGGVWSVEDIGTANHEGIGGTANALYAVSWGGIYRWDGATWTFESPPGEAKLNDVWASGDTAIAVGQGGVIITRAADGSWTEVESGTDADLHAIDGAANDLWAVGADGVVLHFDGSAWTVSDAGTTAALWAVFAPETNSVFIAGNNGTARKWDGAAWSALPTGVDNNLYALHGVSAANVWAVGNRGTALQYKAE